MNIKLLTNEEQEELRKSEHVTEVTEKTVKFSPEFKKLAYSELKKGRKMRDVLTENGIDVSILGMTRVYGFTRTLKVKAAENDGFSDGRAKNGKKPVDTKDLSDDDWRDSTDERIAYLEQEVEFLKKNLEAYAKAKSIWETGLARKKDSRS